MAVQTDKCILLLNVGQINFPTTSRLNYTNVYDVVKTMKCR